MNPQILATHKGLRSLTASTLAASCCAFLISANAFLFSFSALISSSSSLNGHVEYTINPGKLQLKKNKDRSLHYTYFSSHTFGHVRPISYERSPCICCSLYSIPPLIAKMKISALSNERDHGDEGWSGRRKPYGRSGTAAEPPLASSPPSGWPPSPRRCAAVVSAAPAADRQHCLSRRD